MEELATIEIEGKEIVTNDGKKFIAWKAYDKKGKKYDLHFKKEVQGIPTATGKYNMEVAYTDFNIKSDRYNTMWVGGKVTFTEYTIDREAVAAKLKELF